MHGVSCYPSLPALMRAVRRTRVLLGMKQSHLAELVGVGQSSLSKWESGIHVPPREKLALLARFVVEAPGEPSNAILKRLVEQSSREIHLVCDATHCLLAASPSRRAEWRLPEGTGIPMWRYATAEIRRAEERLAGLGWADGPDMAVVFATSESHDPVVPIRPGRVLWERLPIGGLGWGRLVTTLHHAEPPPDNAKTI